MRYLGIYITIDLKNLFDVFERITKSATVYNP